MMMDLKKPLKQGDKVSVTLEFEKTGKVTASLDVQGVGAPGPLPQGGGKIDMNKTDGHSGMKM
jgi:copper(I)-binding protein